MTIVQFSAGQYSAQPSNHSNKYNALLHSTWLNIPKRISLLSQCSSFSNTVFHIPTSKEEEKKKKEKKYWSCLLLHKSEFLSPFLSITAILFLSPKLVIKLTFADSTFSGSFLCVLTRDCNCQDKSPTKQTKERKENNNCFQLLW